MILELMTNAYRNHKGTLGMSAPALPTKSGDLANAFFDDDDPPAVLAVRAAGVCVGPAPKPTPLAPRAIPNEPPPPVHVAPARAPKGQTLYFDLETVPDYSRLELFGLDPLPEAKKETPLAKCPVISDVLRGTVPAVKESLVEIWPCEEWLAGLDAAERGREKPRDGVIEAIKKFRESKGDGAKAAEERRKLLSVTPEFCRIVALGYAIGDAGVVSMVLNDINTEEAIISAFWRLVKSAKNVSGYNVLGFDLPVIFMRSLILDIAPTKLFDLKPWGNDVIDLMKVRWAAPGSKAMKLKDLARVLGIPIPAGDVDGSQVEALWKTDPEKLGEYVRSDVEITRAVHRKFSGFFCN